MGPPDYQRAARSGELEERRVLSELMPTHRWECILPNQTALRQKLRLFFRRNAVVDAPHRVRDGDEPVD